MNNHLSDIKDIDIIIKEYNKTDSIKTLINQITNFFEIKLFTILSGIDISKYEYSKEIEDLKIRIYRLIKSTEIETGKEALQVIIERIEELVKEKVELEKSNIEA